MSVFLSTEDGRILLVRIDDRRHLEMADFEMTLTDLAVTASGTLLGTDGRLVYQLDIGQGTKTPIALISSGDIVSIDSDGSERTIIGTASGQIWRQERDGSLTDIGQFDGGIQEMARIGGFAFAATNAGTIAVMNLLDGSVEELIAHRLGDIDALCAEGKLLRLTVNPDSSQPQFFLFDPKTLELTFENSLLGFYDDVTGSASGTLDTVVFAPTAGEDVRATGTALADILLGGDGDDQLYGRDGNDSLRAGAGDDLLNGEQGVDILNGGMGDDLINGGIGKDWAVFDAAAATVDLMLSRGQDTGHGFNDVLISIENLRGSDFADELLGDSGSNVIEGGRSSDTLDGRGGDDILRGGGGDDFLTGGDGDDILNGGVGFDTAIYSGETAINLYLSTSFYQDTGASGRDRLLGIEGVIGSLSADTIGGNSEANRIQGQSGDDSILGGAGDDTLEGQDGNDFVHGGNGADQLFGGSGDDTLKGGLGQGSDISAGGAGADTFVFVVLAANGQSENKLTISDFDTNEGDRIELIGATAGDFDDWQVESINDASDTLIRFTNGTEIELSGVHADTASADWFV